MHQHDPHAVDGRRAGGQLRPPRHADGAWRRWPTASGSASCASTRQDPIWPNRDRFVLSAGHASMLLYSLLHLTGVKAVSKDYETLGEPSVPLDDIKHFRQLDSSCPGHPEYRWTSRRRDDHRPARPGRRHQRRHGHRRPLAGRALQPARLRDLFDFNVYALCGDGCMMEGISAEAASLAGHLKLSNLCWIYDNNHITIEGNTALAFSEDVATRFIGYGWNVTRVGDANDLEMLARAFRTFQNTHDRPTLIIVDSHIAYGAPEQAGHQRRPRRAARRGGDPADQAQLRLAGGRQVPRARRRLRALPRRHRQARQGAARRLVRASSRSTRPSIPSWPTSSIACSTASCPTAGTRTCRPSRPTPRAWPRATPPARCSTPSAKNVPWLIGGSADLAPSTQDAARRSTAPATSQPDSHGGRNLHFGIREHAMGAVLNGMALVKVRPYGSDVPDLQRLLPGRRSGSAPSWRLPVIYVFTHDSIGVGEDGPTHQPIEQLAVAAGDPRPDRAAARPTPTRWSEAWKVIMQLHHEPAALVLTRQALPTLDRTKYAPAVGRGPRRLRPGRRRRTASPTCCCWPPAARSRSAWRPTSSSRRRASRPAW